MYDILVVDDDVLIRSLVADWLASAGYSVRDAEHGMAALIMLRAEPARLLITDMQMPCLDGQQTLTVLRREFPELPVIAMSGQFRSGLGLTGEMALQLGARKVLAKPFARVDLLDLVREVVGAT